MIAPLQPVSPIQSLGYLEAGQLLECRESLMLSGGAVIFTAGNCYAVNPVEITIRRAIKRPSVSGPEHEHFLTAKDTAFLITDDNGVARVFADQRHSAPGIIVTSANGAPVRITFTTKTLLEKFIIPAPADIASLNPEHIAYNLKFLDEFERVVNFSK